MTAAPRPRVAAILALAVLAVPRVAAACPTCISTGYGDRSYTWAYLGLILMPFVVATAIVAVLAWYAGWRPRDLRARISTWSARLRHPRTPLSPRTTTETP